MKYIDLSHQLTDKTLTYPSDPNIIISKEKKIKTDGSLLNSIKMGTHTGTHLDVPAHIIEKGKTLGDFPLSSFTGKSVKVDKNTFSSLKNLLSKTFKYSFKSSFIFKIVCSNLCSLS